MISNWPLLLHSKVPSNQLLTTDDNNQRALPQTWTHKQNDGWDKTEK